MAEEDESIFTLNKIDESEKQSNTDKNFNGINMLQQKEYLDCKLGPNAQGNYVSVKIPILDYEIMCKQTGDFCNCDTGEIDLAAN